jgi:hypothetical protein
VPELTRVTICHEGRDDVELYFEWEGAIVESNSILWSVLVTTPRGDSYQLGYKLVDGEHAAQFAFDHATARQTNFEQDVDMGSNSLRARFPYLLSEKVGRLSECTCLGVLNIDGQDVSTFPKD